MTFEVKLPVGFGWCGGCGSSTRLLSSSEAQVMLEQATAAVASGVDALEVLGELLGPAHMVLCGVCDCPPLPVPPLGDDAPDQGCFVYRLWDADGRLLYVGVSTRLRRRLRSHERRWGDLIDHATWEQHPDVEAMLAAEREAVRNEDPALNKALIT